MSITPGGWTSFDNPAASPLVNYMSTAGQPVSYGTNSTGGQASQAMQQVLFGAAPQNYTPYFGPSVQGGVDSNGMPLPSTADFIDYRQVLNSPGDIGISNGFTTTPVPKSETARDAYIRRTIGATSDNDYSAKYNEWKTANPGKNIFDLSRQFDSLSAEQQYGYLPGQPNGMMGKGGGQPIQQPAPTPAPGQAPFAQDYQQYVFERNLGLQTPDSPPVLDYQTWLSQNPQGDQRFRMPAPAPTPAPAPAPVTQPKQNSLTQALARTRTAGQGYVRPQARQVARNTQPRLSTAPIRNRTK